MPLEENDVVVGKVVAPFGTKGEVKVVILTDFPERFSVGNQLMMIEPSGNRRNVKIKLSTPNKGGVSIKFEGVNTRSDAEALRHSTLVIDQSEVADLGEGQFYIFDLMGMRVVTDDGREQGDITEVLQGGANDVYVTSNGLLIPAIKDVIANVDVSGRVMTIHPIPGLLKED